MLYCSFVRIRGLQGASTYHTDRFGHSRCQIDLPKHRTTSTFILSFSSHRQKWPYISSMLSLVLSAHVMMLAFDTMPIPNTRTHCKCSISGFWASKIGNCKSKRRAPSSDRDWYSRFCISSLHFLGSTNSNLAPTTYYLLLTAYYLPRIIWSRRGDQLIVH